MKRRCVPRHAAKRHHLQQTPTSEDNEIEDPFACGSSDDKSYRPQTSESSDVECDTNSIVMTPTPTDHSMLSTSSSKSSAILKPSSRSLGEPGKRLQTYFQIETVVNNDKVGTCSICKKQIKMKNANNTGLKKHLRARHNKQYRALFPPSNNIDNDPQQRSITQMFSSKNQDMVGMDNTSSAISQQKLDDMLVEWLAAKYLPFSFFDDDQTQNLFHYLNNKAVMPKRSSMRSKVLSRFSVMQHAVMSILKDNESKFSFTIDGWTSVSNKSYYGITCHFVDNNWTLQSLVIDFVPSHGQHTGKDIANVFYNSLKKYGLQEKIQGITVDNVSANTTFLSELSNIINQEHGNGEIFNTEDQHFRCFAHVLNLAVQDLLKILGIHNHMEVPTVDDDEDDELSKSDEEEAINENCPVVSKIRSLFIKIRRSDQWQTKLKYCCDLTNIKMMSLTIDVPTRWNSTFDMIKIALKMQPALNALCDNNEKLKVLRVSDVEWALLKQICGYLQHFKALSTTLGGENYVTLSLVVLGFNMLVDRLETHIQQLDNKLDRSPIDENIMLVLQAARDKLLKHYRKSNWIYCVVLIADPRHKVETFKLTYWGREMLNSSLKKFEEIYKTYYVPEARSAETATFSSQDDTEMSASEDDDDVINVSSLFESSVFNKNNEDFDGSQEYWRRELDEYLSAKRACKEEDILIWWRTHQSTYPTVSKMARDLLSTPATSVPAERLFSRAALTIRKHRNRLNAESARSLLCLNSWTTCRLYQVIQARVE